MFQRFSQRFKPKPFYDARLTAAEFSASAISPEFFCDSASDDSANVAAGLAASLGELIFPIFSRGPLENSAATDSASSIAAACVPYL